MKIILLNPSKKFVLFGKAKDAFAEPEVEFTIAVILFSAPLLAVKPFEELVSVIWAVMSLVVISNGADSFRETFPKNMFNESIILVNKNPEVILIFR